MRLRGRDGVVHVKRPHQPCDVGMIMTNCELWYSLEFIQAEEYMAKATDDAPTCLRCVAKEARCSR